MKILISTVLLALVILTETKPTPSRLYINPVAEALKSKNGTYGDFGPYFEGDMMLTEEQVEQIISNKVAPIADNLRWTNNKIPYFLADKFPPEEEKIINAGIEMFNSNLKNCIQIVPWKSGDNVNNVVCLKRQEPCASSTGMQTQAQQLLLGGPCFDAGGVAHEFIHAAGFFHEQSRPDRDDYVTFHPENLMDPRLEDQYRKYGSQEAELYNLPYDYDSIMHYSAQSSGKVVKGKQLVVLEPKQAGVEIGQRDHMSANDIAMIRARYGCDK